jgi:PQQ-dependent dehydrogenase (methanol/ethanol family)
MADASGTWQQRSVSPAFATGGRLQWQASENSDARFFGALRFSVWMIKSALRVAVILLTASLWVNAQAPSSPAPANLYGADHEDGQWTMPAKNYQGTRYSGLDQINATNAKDLKVAWTFSTGVNRGHEAAPIVVGDTMYVVTPFPNILYALDLKDNGKLKWTYKPQPASAAQGVACCDTVNRGCVFSNGKLYFNTLDDHTICVDAATGKEVWKTKVGEINHGESMTMAPLVVKDKVLVGNAGGEFGVRGWLKALDANSGKVVWTAWSTGPDRDVLIGADFKPFYDKDKGKDLGVTTWPPNRWQIGGGTVWGWVTYDPESNLIFYGTGNPGVWNPELRPGDNKWSCGIFARDPETGMAHWYYQLNPHDLFDHDTVNENLVLDLPIGGQQRKILLSAQRNGMVYIWDRKTGEVLSADPFVRITATFGVDLKTGKLKENPEKEPHTGVTIHDVAPASPGGKDWQPCAWSPRTNLLYIPHQNLAMDYEGTEANYIEGTPYVGMNVKMYANGGENRGEYCAWDPIARKKIWAILEDLPVWSGTVATAGDVTFYGTMDGWFKCVNAKTGEVVWKFKCGSGIIGQPVTYKGPDGKQYVAILSGVGGWAGAIVAGGLDPKDPTGALGFVNAMKDLPDKTTKGGMLYVFALP